MRKGSYFYVLQQSDRGIRFLLYAMDRVHHSSIALGCSMIMPNVNEQIKLIKEELKKFTIKQIQELNIPNFIELIEQNNLYFL